MIVHINSVFITGGDRSIKPGSGEKCEAGIDKLLPPNHERRIISPGDYIKPRQERI
jgi:hypothetical protein